MTTSRCRGSVRKAKPLDCDVAVSRIKVEDTYTNGSEFSYGECLLEYRTSGQGTQRVSGQAILDAVHRIYEKCPRHKAGRVTARGSMGTGNCDACHVTINYREAPSDDFVPQKPPPSE
ncbi:MAG: hypothetical protein LQ338_003577 [Usnochroma carphineum]|nr:MAG: hypothetical protein LQ338_003577 [Usnochroma carphineum]